MTGRRLNNGEIFAYALYRLQATGQFVDVEDVFVECWRLSPSRFGWRKYDYPNYKVAAKAQQEFEEAHPELVIKTPDGLNRQLSASGVAWVRARLPRFEQIALSHTKAPSNRRASHRILVELAKSGPVRAFRGGKAVTCTKVDIGNLMRCAPDSPPWVWRERLETLRSAAENDERPDLIRFLDHVAAAHPEWFQGG